MVNLYKTWINEETYFVIAKNQHKAVKKTLKFLDKSEEFYTDISVEFIGIDDDFINLNIK